MSAFLDGHFLPLAEASVSPLECSVLSGEGGDEVICRADA
jgi:hypothetical protein